MEEQIEHSGTQENIFCAHCGTQNEDSHYACVRCGERLVKVVNDAPSSMGLTSCPECGSANPERAAYCWMCGSEMNDAIDTSPSPNRESKPEAARSQYRPNLNPVSTQVSESTVVRSDLNTNPAQGTADAPVEAEPNNSGTKGADVPTSIRRWNWAAFLMPEVWGLFSGVPWAILLLVAGLLLLQLAGDLFPLQIGYAVMFSIKLFLGFRGNEFAWRGKKWRSVEHFNAFQKQWTTWSIALFVLTILILYILSNRGGEEFRF